MRKKDRGRYKTLAYRAVRTSMLAPTILCLAFIWRGIDDGTHGLWLELVFDVCSVLVYVITAAMVKREIYFFASVAEDWKNAAVYNANTLDKFITMRKEGDTHEQ